MINSWEGTEKRQTSVKQDIMHQSKGLVFWIKKRKKENKGIKKIRSLSKFWELLFGRITDSYYSTPQSLFFRRSDIPLFSWVRWSRETIMFCPSVKDSLGRPASMQPGDNRDVFRASLLRSISERLSHKNRKKGLFTQKPTGLLIAIPMVMAKDEADQ